MIIGLDSIGKNVKSLKLEFEPEEIGLDQGTRLTTTVTFDGDIRRDGAKTHVSGHIEGKMETDCFRCLESVGTDIDITFEAVFVDALAEPETEEIELGEDELDESLIVDNKIDMADVVREQLILATTEKVLCKEDCKGLCPQCGENRNLIDCKCEEKIEDPRWAALKNLN